MKTTTDLFLKSTLKQALSSLYWFSGDEPFQLEESKLALYQKAQAEGFSEIQHLDGKNLDPQFLKGELYNYSLLSPSRLIEIRLTLGKIDSTLADLLLAFLIKPNPGVIVVLISPKFESGVSASKFYKSLEEKGVIIQSWPIHIEYLPKWLSQRLANEGLKTTLDGLKALAELTEGNLLYAAQSIEKLKLIYPNHTMLSREEIFTVITPQTVFDTFQLNDAFLAGDKIRALKICRTLQASGAEIILSYGALMKDLRLIFKLQQLGGEKQFAANCQKLGIWEKKRPLYRQALQKKASIPHLIKHMLSIDQCIKNNKHGDPWLALERFLMQYT